MKMVNNMKPYTIGLFLLLFLNICCAPTMQPPDWYIDESLLVKEYPGMVVATGEATHPMMQVAKEEASFNARSKLASMLGTNELNNTKELQIVMIESREGYTVFVAVGVDKGK